MKQSLGLEIFEQDHENKKPVERITVHLKKITFMKKFYLFYFIATLSSFRTSAQDTLKELIKQVDTINRNISAMKTSIDTLNKRVEFVSDTVHKIVNDQLIVDQSMLDSAKKFPVKVLYQTYFFDKMHKKTSGEWVLFFVTLLVLFLMWGAAIYYAKTDSLLKDVCFDKDGNQMKAQYAPFSYSRSQLLWWTLIVLSCYIFFFGITSVLVPLNVTSVLLLGFGAMVYASGKLIDNAQIDKGRGDRNQDQGAQNQEEPKFFKDILSDDNGISIHRFQAVVFNVVFGIGFIAFFVKSLYHQRYPLIEFTDWQFALIGISSATYLGLKASENKDAQSTKAAKQKTAQALRNTPQDDKSKNG